MADISDCGLALVTFPFAISILEIYKEVARGRKRLEWLKILNELKYHQFLFVRNTRLLLAPVVNEAELHQLTISPSKKVWSHPDLTHALEERLKDSYNVFLRTISRVLSALERLIEEIHVAKNDMNNNISGGVIRNKELRRTYTRAVLEFKRLGVPRSTIPQTRPADFTLGESVRKGVFDDIQECNDILEKLIPKNASVPISYLTDKSRVLSTSAEAALCGFWHHADELYKALLTAWKCGRPDRHSAHLELQPRLHVSDQGVRLVLSTHTIHDVWFTLPVMVKIGQEPTRSSTRVSSHREAVSRRAPKWKRKITFRFTNAPSVGKRVSTISGTSFESQAIYDLCTALSSGINPEGVSSIGYLRDPDGGEYHDKVYICPGRPSDTPSKSLSELIGEGFRPRLTRAQRYYLAVTISSSFIQLNDTSWFPRTLENLWSKNSIFIPAQAENPDILLLDRPFIKRHFIDVSTSGTSPRNRRILDVNRLGIMLLELCFNMAIESHPARSRFPSSHDLQTNTMFDLITALEWRKDVNKEAGQEYSDAIEWCLVGCRTMPTADNGTGGAGNWRRQMLEKVTLPLQNCYQCIIGDMDLERAFESSLSTHDPTKFGHALAPSSAKVLHDEHGYRGYSRTTTANTAVESWHEGELASRRFDFTQPSRDQLSELSSTLSIYKVSRRDHKNPSLNPHTSDSPLDILTEQRNHSLIDKLSPSPSPAYSSSSSVEHQLVPSTLPPFKCLCGQEFRKLRSLERHIRYYKLILKYTCPECNILSHDKEEFTKQDHFLQHLRSFHKYGDSQLADFFARHPQYSSDSRWKDIGVGQQKTDRSLSQSLPPASDMSGNAAIEEIRRKADLIECAIGLLSYNDVEHDALRHTLATRFKLWLSVNGVFEDSLMDRFSATDDHSLLSLFINKMGRLERLLPDPLGNGPPTSPGWEDLQKSRHLIASLHRVGEAMRIEFPANSLVQKIRKVLSGRESDHTNIINPSDVRQEISNSMLLRLQPEQTESYVSQVCEDYRVVFAILVLLYKPSRIFGFIEGKISDDKLPITEEFLVKSQKHRGWRSDDAARFVHAQHMILDRLQELSSAEPKQELPKASVPSIPIRNKDPTSSPGPSTTKPENCGKRPN
ncbi:hypothetical protein F5B17DRAFT_426871 [Nemania serpens]|nr:hypothetical protein F5B17DRAFT_426871 [Nemania serpens]